MGGEPKALLEVGGRRIIERVADVLRQVTDEQLLVTNTPDRYAWMGLPMVPDVFPDAGSLGGIYSGLKAAGEAAFTVACDMPFLSAAVARYGIDRDLDARVTLFGTLSRNVDQDTRAFKDGLRSEERRVGTES